MTTNSVRTPATWALPFGATLVAMFALQLSNLGFSPLLPSIQQEFGRTISNLACSQASMASLALALSVPAGISAKRFGERRVLGVGLLGVAAGSLLLGQAWDFESALAFRGLTIFGYRFAFVCVLVAVALTAPPSLRGRTMGYSRRHVGIVVGGGRLSAACWWTNWVGARQLLAMRRWPYLVFSRSGFSIDPLWRRTKGCRNPWGQGCVAPHHFFLLWSGFSRSSWAWEASDSSR